MPRGRTDRKQGTETPGRSAPAGGKGTDRRAGPGTTRRTASEDRLGEYRRRRDPARTPEPVPAEGDSVPEDRGRRIFVIQEHHATSLHWDLRLERDGVLVSWAVPRGLPPDPATNHLAVHTEDHPMEYADFSGEIPAGEYGGGTMTVWDRGTYTTEKWAEREVKVVLDGERTQGRFVLFHTDGRNWMAHRMDAPVRPDWRPLPAGARPMSAVPGRMPAAASDASWYYEFDWPGYRVLVAVEGGRARITSAEGADVTSSLPEIRPVGETLGLTSVLMDGVLVAFDETGRPAPDRVRSRIGVTGGDARTLSRRVPAVLLVSDLLHLDGRPLSARPYEERRERLAELGVDGPHWKVSPSFGPGGGAAVRAAAREQGLTGILAKRAGSPYREGRESADWRAVRS
jgi:bifunctional non-homologous end joining protein LigD